MAAVNEEATFSHISFTRLGSYKLKASAVGMTAVMSNVFTIGTGGFRPNPLIGKISTPA